MAATWDRRTQPGIRTLQNNRGRCAAMHDTSTILMYGCYNSTPMLWGT